MKFILKNLTVIAVALLPVIAFAESSPIELMKAATVRIVCKTMLSGTSSGSGLLVGNGDHVVTNNHVIECTGTGGELIVIHSREERISASVLWKSADKDLAVLRLKGSIGGAVPAFATSSMVADAQTVYAMGFPGDADMSKESLFQVKISKGIISAKTKVDDLKVYLTDAPINSGNSGGPLFNESGHVVGINFMKAKKMGTEGIGYAIQADELLPELDRLGVPYRLATTSGQIDAPKPVDTPPSPQQKSDSLEQSPQSDANKSSTSPILYLAIGAAIILSGAAIFLSTTQRGKDIAQRGSNFITRGKSSKDPVQPAGSRPLVLGISGAFAGNDIRMGTEVLSFGRDPQQCQIVFPKEAEGVGRLHCTLRFDDKNKAFILTDKDSTNGTYMGNGERLSPGASCQIGHGGRFYLATPRNLFEVRLT